MGIKDKLKEKLAAYYAKFIAARNRILDKGIDIIVNIEPLNETEHKLSLVAAVVIWLGVICMNVGSLMPASIFCWIWYFYYLADGCFITRNTVPTFYGVWRRFVDYISQEAPVTTPLPVAEVLSREANK